MKDRRDVVSPLCARYKPDDRSLDVTLTGARIKCAVMVQPGGGESMNNLFSVSRGEECFNLRELSQMTEKGWLDFGHVGVRGRR